tara:strand:- start:4125 stop:4790 length:666 start_codon:yes stop_codon:yes gene_type:complete
MATYRTQIENLAGISKFNTNAEEVIYLDMLNNFLKQSSRMVLDVLNNDYLNKDSLSINLSSADGVVINTKKISKVLRNNVGCIEIPLEAKDKVEAGSTSIYAPTTRSPIYYIEGQASGGAKLFIRPACSVGEVGKVYYNELPAPLHSDQEIVNFPDEAEYSVIIGAAVKVLQYRLNRVLHDDEDAELSQVMQAELQMVNSIFVSELSRLSGIPMGQPQGES